MNKTCHTIKFIIRYVQDSRLALIGFLASAHRPYRLIQVSVLASLSSLLPNHLERSPSRQIFAQSSRTSSPIVILLSFDTVITSIHNDHLHKPRSSSLFVLNPFTHHDHTLYYYRRQHSPVNVPLTIQSRHGLSSPFFPRSRSRSFISQCAFSPTKCATNSMSPRRVTSKSFMSSSPSVC